MHGGETDAHRNRRGVDWIAGSIRGPRVLSPKTVESHLRNTFRKLGVSTRVEVARTVERADRTP